MNAPTEVAPRGQIRHLQRDLVEAADGKIMRVLAMVDGMAARGDADALIAPLRGRLAQLRPQRPLSFVRLLFTPFDPLILPAGRWRRGAPALPRTALAPLGAAIQAGLGAEFAGLDARIASVGTEQAATLARAEAGLWPRAAEILAGADPPADWTAATGLPADDHRLIARSLAALFAQTGPLLRLLANAAAAPPLPAELHALLAGVLPAGADALAMMAALLMARLPSPEPLVAVADELAARHPDPAVRVAADQAVEFLLDGIEATPMDGGDLAHAAAELTRTVVLLRGLEGRPGQRPARRSRIEQLRRQVDAGARTRFAADLDGRLLRPAALLAAATPAEITALELRARELRRFEGQARQLGGGEQYDRALRHAAQMLHPAAAESHDTRVDRVRLVEILQGPEAALALLNAA